MPCLKSINIDQAITGETPLHEAVYVSSVDKIFGVSGPYVVQFNSTTGLYESAVRIGSPLYGDMRICHHAANSTLYVASWFEPNRQWYSLTHPLRDVFPVDPVSLTVGVGMGIGVAPYFHWTEFSNTNAQGPWWIGSKGNYLYIHWNDQGGYYLRRVDPTNIADRNSQYGYYTRVFWTDQCATGDTHVFRPSPWDEEVEFAPLNYSLNSSWDSVSLTGYHPVGCDWCGSNSKCYLVCGDTNLIRIDDLVAYTKTYLSLAGVLATANPCRIRYRSSDQKLYLPCATDNSIIVWNPTTESGILKSGFDNPIDVVFTNSKAFAVQEAVVGLKEIT